ncbi:hypothetical protein Krad_2252 [Kineococcus radiotolerans SRS30216 = ATCC BAA-149]|uniref:Lipoprotein n=2 Tax=Kineococcus radiotolerans TaxID=131568 RepID=A6WA94_KINRD|nr:hypothetical protein Krad_2252 [Kineococcus radiotolerans SRS30216 = ATCC BAA-149]
MRTTPRAMSRPAHTGVGLAVFAGLLTACSAPPEQAATQQPAVNASSGCLMGAAYNSPTTVTGVEDWLIENRDLETAYLEQTCTQPSGPARDEAIAGAEARLAAIEALLASPTKTEALDESGTRIAAVHMSTTDDGKYVVDQFDYWDASPAAAATCAGG